MKLFALRHFLETCRPDTRVTNEVLLAYTDYTEKLVHELPVGRSQRFRRIQCAIICDLWVWLAEQEILAVNGHTPIPLPRVYPN